VWYPIGPLTIAEVACWRRLSSVVVVASHTPPTGRTLARDVTLYTVARLAMVAVVSALLVLAGVPLLVSILLALVVALPLSMLLLGSLRSRVNAGLAVARVRRKAERERLRRQLRGEE
jgi:Protein of unknown function (DUF4229)